MARFVRIVCLLALSALPGMPAWAQDEARPVRFTVDWALQGNHAIFALAEDNGHFAEQGLAVTMDRGYGSGDTLVKVASGAYDIGYADMNGLVPFNAQNPDNPLIVVFQVLDRTLASVVTLKSSGIARPADLAGKTLGAPEGEASRVLFPPFARANGLDPASVSWTSMAPNIRESMLAQGQVDAITGFISTSFFNLIAAGISEDDIVSLPFPDYGLDLYGSAIVTTAAYAEAHSDVVRGFVAATIAGINDTIADPEAGMEALVARDPLFDPVMEVDRLQLVLDRAMLTDNVKANGFGAIEPERMAKAVAVVADAYGIAQPPAAETLYTDAYLPPAAERMPAP
ncbi:ABC transporter substrate-binding protein [Marinivivus vitaminiproducens]|uniref:ABC transporter substrate-binding protein n=1 Tax=Marinivivus vitaminiproducens TaxID=3035935 RepID=UPI00279A75D2|nr:ABC transporter substrate-binding protein [Geminicoccaceae bacterium SCSIO 64248]